jgi:maltooligosyltrehalose trehalohydrolase
VLLLSPFLPLLFMGEEYGETAPFQYFVSFLDPELVAAVRQGRRQEFAGFVWDGEPPDPQGEETFRRSRLHRELRQQGRHRALYELHRELIRLRRTLPALAHLSKDNLAATSSEEPRALVVRRGAAGRECAAVYHFGEFPAAVQFFLPPGRWAKILDSEAERWYGDGSPVPAVLEVAGEVSLTLPPQAFVLFAAEEVGNGPL